MDGKELIEHFRALSPTTRVICSTACVRTANTFDIVNILSKPYTSQELLLRVKQVLAQ
jgi:DNA-binding response OmpR family regulator